MANMLANKSLMLLTKPTATQQCYVHIKVLNYWSLDKCWSHILSLLVIVKYLEKYQGLDGKCSAATAAACVSLLLTCSMVPAKS